MTLTLLVGCSQSKPYIKPNIETPVDFQAYGQWKPASLPADINANHDPWAWLADPQLKTLLQKVSDNNPSILSLNAQYRAALATLGKATAASMPTVNATGSASHGTLSSVSSFSNSSLPKGEIYALGANTSWEIDVWGRIQQEIDSNRAQAEASYADMRAAIYSTQALFAQSYLQLRAIDKQSNLLAQTELAFSRFYRLTLARQRAGVVSALDVAQAETQWRNAQAQFIELTLQRSQLANSCALLLGVAPSSFELPPLPDYQLTPITLPRLIPSQQVEHRPDILAAERRMAAANAQIGAAETAFFPVITLGASANYRNTDIQHLISLPNTLWSVGPNLAFNLFDGGLRASAVALAQANYDQTVANYRQTVLSAFEEVENNLATEAALTQEIQVQQQAIAAANTALRIAQSQYRAGTTSALNVISAQTTLWTAEKNAIDLWSRLLQSKINIIKSIGFTTNSK